MFVGSEHKFIRFHVKFRLANKIVRFIIVRVAHFYVPTHLIQLYLSMQTHTRYEFSNSLKFHTYSLKL